MFMTVLRNTHTFHVFYKEIKSCTLRNIFEILELILLSEMD